MLSITIREFDRHGRTTSGRLLLAGEIVDDGDRGATMERIESLVATAGLGEVHDIFGDENDLTVLVRR